MGSIRQGGLIESERIVVTAGGGFIQDALEQEERALGTMSELLHVLLNIAKLESGSLQTSIADVFLPAMFEDLRQQLQALANLKRLELVVATPGRAGYGCTGGVVVLP